MFKSQKPKYKIVTSSSRVRLNQKINKLMKKGWTTQGGISANKKTFSAEYTQAMIKNVKGEN